VRGVRKAVTRRTRPPNIRQEGTYQPSEPILFPKLRIYFADFPYLHYSIDQRLLTLETWCGYGYGPSWISLTQIFMGHCERTWHLWKARCSAKLTAFSLG